MIPQSLINAIRSKSIVPLVGSGLSQASGMASWIDITNSINSCINSPQESSLGFSALDAPDKLALSGGGAGTLREILEQAVVRGYKPNKAHDYLVDIPFETILTTNWDSLIESSLKKRFRTNVVYNDDTARSWRESEARQVVKFHGTAEHLQSVIFGLASYAKLYQGSSLIMSLVRTIISTRSVMAVGFGMNDPFLKALFIQNNNSYGPRHFVAMPESEIEVNVVSHLSGIGFEVIPLKETKQDPFGINSFLQKLRAETYNNATKKLDRTNLLVRETNRLNDYLGSEKVIRVRASLGPFAVPNQKSKNIFGSIKQHEKELELLESVEAFIAKKRGKVKLICNPIHTDTQAKSKGYSLDAHKIRLQSQYDNIAKNIENIEVAVSRRPMDINEWIVADIAKVESRKQSGDDDRLYAFAQLELAVDPISRSNKHFDLEFDNLTEGYQTAKESTLAYLSWLKEELSTL